MEQNENNTNVNYRSVHLNQFFSPKANTRQMNQSLPNINKSLITNNISAFEDMFAKARTEGVTKNIHESNRNLMKKRRERLLLLPKSMSIAYYPSNISKMHSSPISTSTPSNFDSDILQIKSTVFSKQNSQNEKNGVLKLDSRPLSRTADTTDIHAADTPEPLSSKEENKTISFLNHSLSQSIKIFSANDSIITTSKFSSPVKSKGSGNESPYKLKYSNLRLRSEKEPSTSDLSTEAGGRIERNTLLRNSSFSVPRLTDILSPSKLLRTTSPVNFKIRTHMLSPIQERKKTGISLRKKMFREELGETLIGTLDEKKSENPIETLRNQIELFRKNSKDKQRTIRGQEIPQVEVSSNNVVKYYRSVLVLHADIRYNLKVAKIKIPIYDKIYNKDDLRKDMDNFLRLAQDTLFCFKPFKGIFLINGEPIVALSEIPLECNVVLVDHILVYHLKTRFLDYHNMTSIAPDKWNLILYLINLQKEEHKLRYLLRDEKFLNLIVKNDKLRFDTLLRTKNMNKIQKVKRIQDSKYGEQVKEAINSLEDLYNGTANAKVDDEIKQEFIKTEYDKSFRRIRDEYEKKLDPVKFKRYKIFEELFNDFELFLKNKDNRALYIDYLEDLLTKSPEIQNEIISTVKTKKEPIVFSTDKKEKNFVLKNRRNTEKDTVKVYKGIFEEFGALYKSNIPKLQAESAFNRRELHKLFIKYKALCADFGLNKMNKNEKYDPAVGFDPATFKEGFTQFKLSEDSLIRKIFTYGGDPEVGAEMTWEKFLRLMMSIRAKSLKDKIGLFLRLMDMDGNGNLSWTEINLVCLSALKFYRSGDNDPIIDNLAEFFTQMVFDAVGIQTNEEIPIRRLKQIVDKGIEAIDLLLQFSGAEQLQDEEIILENNCIEKKIPKVKSPADM